jgi:hypothetical protein
MDKKLKIAVESYQCPGCVVGGDTECYEKCQYGVGCGKHVAGTTIFPNVGKIFLGMPKGFNRTGPFNDMRLEIYNTYEDYFSGFGKDKSKFNIVCWKHLNKSKHTLIRGLSPRVNRPYLIVILEDCMDKIEGEVITKEDIEEMD